jgi:hypothetical protein
LLKGREMTNLEILREFLLKNDIWHEYLNNCKLYLGKQRYTEFYINRKLDKINPKDIMHVDYCFIWWCTPEGNEFWKNINIKWIEYLEIDNSSTNSNVNHECTCGAKHTSTPNFHLNYCDIKANNETN